MAEIKRMGISVVPSGQMAIASPPDTECLATIRLCLQHESSTAWSSLNTKPFHRIHASTFCLYEGCLAQIDGLQPIVPGGPRCKLCHGGGGGENEATVGEFRGFGTDYKPALTERLGLCS